MRNRKQKLKTEDHPGLSQDPCNNQVLSRTLPEYKSKQYKNNSCLEIYKIGKSKHVVNDNLINTFNPKRTSVDLNSFIQVFRKKVRQSSIARQFENSLQKFKALSSNRLSNIKRQKNGFVGSCKKQNQLLIQNNKIDNKIKKIIISDLEFKDRKMKQKISINELKFSRRTLQVQEDSQHEYRSSKCSRNIQTYSSEETSNHRISQRIQPSRVQIYSQQTYNNINPQTSIANNQNCNLCDQRLKTDVESMRQDKVQLKGHNVNSNKTSSIFTNRRLQTIASYQRPNLMYNLSLYRKKNCYNVLKGSKRNIVNTSQDKQLKQMEQNLIKCGI